MTAEQDTAPATEHRTSPPVDPGSLEGQLHGLYAEREHLVRLLGTADADELVTLLDGAGDDGADESLVAQVESLYAERERLEQEIGVSSAEDVIELVRGLQQGRPRSWTQRLRRSTR